MCLTVGYLDTTRAIEASHRGSTACPIDCREVTCKVLLLERGQSGGSRSPTGGKGASSVTPALPGPCDGQGSPGEHRSRDDEMGGRAGSGPALQVRKTVMFYLFFLLSL